MACQNCKNYVITPKFAPVSVPLPNFSFLKKRDLQLHQTELKTSTFLFRNGLADKHFANFSSFKI